MSSCLSLASQFRTNSRNVCQPIREKDSNVDAEGGFYQQSAQDTPAPSEPGMTGVPGLQRAEPAEWSWEGHVVVGGCRGVDGEEGEGEGEGVETTLAARGGWTAAAYRSERQSSPSKYQLGRRT